MTVTEAAYAIARLPLRHGLRHASAEATELVEVFLRVRLADGHTGWAETRGNGEYATGFRTAEIVAALASLPAPPWPEPAALASTLARRCPPVAMLVDIAWRDAVSRQRDVPLWTMLGDAAPTAVPTHAAITFGTVEEAAERAAAAAGFSRIKIRVGGDPRLDRLRVAKVREVAGTAVTLVVDANGGWDIDTAIEAARWLADLGVAWFEQPTSGIGGLAAVRAASPVAVWADESVRDAASVREIAERRAADGVHLKLEKAGTAEALGDAVRTARDHGLDVGLGQMDCGRLGCAITTHLAAGLGTGVAELWGCANVARDVTAGLDLHDGGVPVPTGPGLGVRVALGPKDLTPLRNAT